MRTKLLYPAAVLLVLHLVAAAALAIPPEYMIYDVGVIDPGDYGTQGVDVGSLGTSVYATGRNLGSNNQAYLWTLDTGLVPLPNDPGRPYGAGSGVNGFGTVVGIGASTAWGSSPLPLIWSGGAVAQLPLPAGQTMGRAYDINDDGLVVGSVNGGSLEAAAVYASGGTYVVTTLTGTGCYATTFFDVNNAGLAVGPGLDPANAARNVGFVYDTVADLAYEVGALPGHNGAIAFGVSDAGHVVGASMLNQGSGSPFIWTAADGMTEIPLPPAASSGSARGANSDGWAVGNSGGVYALPFLYDGADTYRIADLIPSGTNWDMETNTSSSAEAITDEGIIVGTGVLDGVPRGYVLVPEGVVPTMLQLFTATDRSAGIELAWEVRLVGESMVFTLERAEDMAGPWSPVAATIDTQGPGARALDTDTVAGRTYHYRLSAPGNDGETLVLGYATGTRLGVAGLWLGAPAPNPARDATSLSYRLPGPQSVRITVHDLRGRLVRTVVDGRAGEGDHVMQWDGCDMHGKQVPAGVYFVNLQSEAGSVSQRVVMAR